MHSFVVEVRYSFYICDAVRSAVQQSIFDESVFAFILDWKSGKFHCNKEGSTLVTLYWQHVW